MSYLLCVLLLCLVRAALCPGEREREGESLREREREREEVDMSSQSVDFVLFEPSELHLMREMDLMLSRIASLLPKIFFHLQGLSLEKRLLDVYKKVISVKASSNLGLLDKYDTASILSAVHRQLLSGLDFVRHQHRLLLGLDIVRLRFRCRRLLQKACERLDAVRKSNLDLRKEQAKYWHQPPLNDDAIQKFVAPGSYGVKVVGIVGEGGIGKTSLLIHCTSRMLKSFSYIVFIELVSAKPNDELLRHAQASILLQLGGSSRKIEDLRHGRVALKERLQNLAFKGLSFCIAIDNVWRSEDLTKILPQTLPPSTSGSIIITTRLRSVVDGLEDMCTRTVPSFNPSQLMLFEQPPMQFKDAHSLMLSQYRYTSKKDWSNDQHHELLDKLCAFCGGNPLVLKAAGYLLARANYSLGKSGESMKEATSLFIENKIVSHGIFEMSYETLQSKSKEALCDIAFFLYQWRWDVVENIVGVDAMEELANIHLIKHVEQESWDAKLAMSSKEQVVGMHDFIRMLSLKKKAEDTAVHSFSSLLSLDKLVLPHVKFLRLDFDKTNKIGASTARLFTQIAAGLIRLTVLELLGSFELNDLLLPESLLYFKLANNNIVTHLSGVQFPCSIRHFELDRLENLVELPLSMYNRRNLQILIIHACPVLHGFISVSNWQCLRTLHLESCYGITQLPEDLENLEQLRLCDCLHLQALPPLPSKRVHVSIKDCPHLSASNQDSVHDATKTDCRGPPALDQPSKSYGADDSPMSMHLCRNVQKLSAVLRCLKIHNCTCRKLDRLGMEEMKNLRKLKLELCRNLVRLPGGICELSSLVTLDVSECSALEQLPQELGRLSALECLELHDCQKLKGLPDSISSLKALVELSLIGCNDVEELPEGIEGLRSLRVMRLSGCQKLRGLPKGIGNLRVLSQLEISSCQDFKKLSTGIGDLCALKTLVLMGCPSIRTLPKNVYKLSSLSTLCVNGCERFEALPKKMGSLHKLTSLAVADCPSLTKLGNGIGKLTSLKMLDLQSCLNLDRLTHNFGSSLGALETVFLMQCQKLESLPDNFCGLGALKELDLSGCVRLEQLPQAFGQLSSLEKLRLSCCRVLRQLPESVCKLRSLAVMDLSGCYMLEKLPMEVGSLDALEELTLVECATLELPPVSFCNLKALKELDLRGSQSVEKVLRAKGQLYFAGRKRVERFFMILSAARSSVTGALTHSWQMQVYTNESNGTVEAYDRSGGHHEE